MGSILIIGGGIAGLAAGCYARMNGYDVDIVEMHDLPGGLCTSWKRKGYTFDYSIHWLEGTNPERPFHRIWQELGALKGKKTYHKDLSLKIFLKDSIVNFYNDPDTLEKHLCEISPEDKNAIREFANTLRTFYSIQDVPLPKPKEMFTVIDKIRDMKSSLPFIGLFLKYGKMSVQEFASKFRSPILRQAILSALDTASMDDSAVNGFFGIIFTVATRLCGFPEGGSLSLARSIEQRYIGLGGKIRYGARVVKILVENDKAVGVRTADGREIRADVVISAADGRDTIFSMLDGNFVSPKIKRIYGKEEVFPSVVQVSIGVDMNVSGIADETAYYNIHGLERPLVIGGRTNNTLRLKNYSFDPTFAPKGKSVLVAFFSSNLSYWEKLHADKDAYREEKKKIEEAVVSRLEELLPGIKERIETVDVTTPMTYIRFTNNWKGSTMGFTKGFMLNIPRTLPRLSNFYMAGQWVGDTGVSGAAKSGRDIIQLICRRDRKEFTATKVE